MKRIYKMGKYGSFTFTINSTEYIYTILDEIKFHVFKGCAIMKNGLF